MVGCQGPTRTGGYTNPGRMATPRPQRALSRPQAFGRAASLARTVMPGKPEEPAAEQSSSLGWLRWGRPTGAAVAAAPRAEPAQASPAPSRSNSVPWGSASSPSQLRPATSPTGTQLVEQPPQPSLPYWKLRKAAAAVAPEAPKQQTAGAPIVSCAGGGIFYFWESGVMQYLAEHFDLGEVQLVGVSAGGLIATLAACGVNQVKAVRAAFRLSQEADIWNRPGGLAGIWGGLVRQWLDELLPEDAHERCNGRVKLVVTEFPSLRLQYIDSFASRDDLINANMASAHIPWLLDGKATASYRGKQWMDGSLFDFFFGSNSDLLTCAGEAFVVDYFNDDQLEYSRLDFVKLADLDYVMELERLGYAYAERLDAAGGLEYNLGPYRKGAVRRAFEFPVRQITKALASVDLV